MPTEETQPNFSFTNNLKGLVKEVDGVLYLNGTPLPKEMIDTLDTEIRYIKASYFWQFFEAQLLDESARMALHESKTWEHVLSGKMLHHYVHVLRAMMEKLTKK